MTVTSVNEVLAHFDAIIDRARQERSRLGFFAALYRGVTVRVEEGIEAGRFQDGPRMERFDVIFANRYFDALERFRRRERTSRCWQVAFESATRRRLLILQHLLIGMNAHINLDLAVAAARTSPGDELPALKGDFDEINAILSEMVDEVQDRIAVVSPWLGLLDRVAGKTDEAVVDFSMKRARDASWSVAQRLAPLNVSDQEEQIARVDGVVAALGRRVRTPGKLLPLALLAIRLRESNDTVHVIDALSQQ